MFFVHVDRPAVAVPAAVVSSHRSIAGGAEHADYGPHSCFRAVLKDRFTNPHLAVGRWPPAGGGGVTGRDGVGWDVAGPPLGGAAGPAPLS
jgi:hypothetical protein